MVKPGVVNVEISIENQILAHIKQVKRKLKVGGVAPLSSALNDLEFAVYNLNHILVLEGREPGKGKFKEIKDIRYIKVDIAQVRQIIKKQNKSQLKEGIRILNKIIKELNLLKRMELRLG